MTVLDTLTRGLSITDTDGINKAAIALMQHMNGSPTWKCTFCGSEHDGSSNLCLACDKLYTDYQNEDREVFDTPNYYC